MKTIKIIISSLLATLALTACTNENDMPDAGTLPEGAVNITASIGGTTTRATIGSDGSGMFENGDTWGMYTTVDGTTVNDNTAYTYGTTVLHWNDLSTTTDVTFSAHYPRQAPIANAEAYDFDVAAAGNPDRKNADLLFATATGSKANNDAANPVNLQFSHLMHRIGVVLNAGDGVGSIYGATVSFMNMKSTARINLLTGAVYYDDASGTTPYHNDGQNFIYVAPQNVTTGTEWIKIELAGDTWIYNVPATLAGGANFERLESGKKLTLTLTLKKTAAGDTEVELTSSGISAWGDQGTINDEVTTGGTTATITADQVKAALTGTGTDPIVIDGDLTLSLDTDIRLGADHTLTINPGATLTLGGSMGILGYNTPPRTLIINGGGAFLVDEAHDQNYVFSNGTLKLEDVKAILKSGIIYRCDIEVGTNATIVVDSRGSNPIQTWTNNTLTVKGKIIIKDFSTPGINCAGMLLIDGGTISIDCIGTSSDVYSPCAISISSHLKIINGGKLTSTVADGTVFLWGTINNFPGCKVEGAKGLFKAGDYTLGTDEEVTVGTVDVTGALRQGVYKWNAGESKFVWASAQ